MKEWDNQEKWDKWFEQENAKILSEIDIMMKRALEAHEKFLKKPKHKQLYHIIIWYFVYPVYTIKNRIERWNDKRQSCYFNPRSLT